MNYFNLNSWYLRMRIASVLLVIGFSNNLHATCILIYIGNNEVIIGSDSKNVIKGFKSDALQSNVTCKIQKFSSFYCAISGITNSIYYDFNPYKIVESKFNQQLALNHRIINLKKEIKEKLTTVLKKIKSNPASWDLVVHGESRILDIALVGKANKKLCVYRIGFILKDPERFDIQITEEMIESTYKSNKYIAFGECTIAGNWLKQNLHSDTPEILIKKSIEAECKVTINSVGLPINIIKVTLKKSQWILNNTCK